MTAKTTKTTTAIEAEATGADTVDVAYGDATYAFPASLEDADGDVLDAIDDEKLSRALRGLMADGQWTEFKKTRPKVKDYAGLFEAYAQAIGLDTAGN